ncbi:hypothetical protein AB4Z42_10675 [Mycobacterium sp. 2YAF39]|uniref:hypothetical protein n=1 Tax=Mycobacterium sp. 2YAF39 TaxID=3233033 RepID=UPI003F9A2BD5
MGVVAFHRLLAATAAALLAVLSVACSSPTNQSAQPAAQGSESPPQRPDFTQVTESMFVDASAIPDASAWDFTGAVLNSDGNYPNDDQIDPPKCAPLFSGLPHGQKGAAGWSMWPTDGSDADMPEQNFTVLLAVPTGQPDLQGLRDLLGKCGTFHAGELTSTVSPPLQHPGLPDSAVAWRQNSKGPYGSKGAEIVGLSRGLYVEVYTWRTDGDEASPADIDILVNLFNEQVTKLQAA